jgi:phage-related protein
VADPILSDDPLAGIINPAPAPPPEAPVELTPEQISAKAESDRRNSEHEALLAALAKQSQISDELRTQLAQQNTPIQEEPTNPDDAAIWQDPRGEMQRIAQQTIQNQVGPQAKEMNAKLGRMVLNGFLTSKTNDPFYAVVLPIFQEKIKAVALDQLGAAPDAAVQEMLRVAWDASVGTYVQKRQADAPKPPANYGGGGTAGGTGPGKKKTLAELDPQSYNMAMQAGLTEEQMQALADEAQEEG